MVLLGLTDSLVTFGKEDSIVIQEAHRQGAIVGIAHWFDDRRNSIEYYVSNRADGFEIANKNQLAYPQSIHKKIIDTAKAKNLFLLGGADYHGYGPTTKLWNAVEIPLWQHLNHKDKSRTILKGIKTGNTRVLYYSDRPAYYSGPLWMSPFKNILDYFRSLNGFQILSWLGWCLLFSIYPFPLKTSWMIKWVPVITGVVLFIHGRLLNIQSIPVLEYNDVFLEFSNVFTGVGLGLLSIGVLLQIFDWRFSRVLTQSD